VTVNEFIKKLGAAGFDFSFRASDGNISVTGECVQLEDHDFRIISRRVKSVQESRAEINRMLRR
jgi:hypothetical protein